MFKSHWVTCQNDEIIYGLHCFYRMTFICFAMLTAVVVVFGAIFASGAVFALFSALG